MYFREFGTPARIGRCNSKEDIEELVDKYNGKRNCYASVYVFDDLRDIEGKTDYDSAILDTIWFDFDDNKDVNKCLRDVRKFIKKYCKPRNITPRIYLTGGKGFQMNIDFHSPLDFSDSIKRRVLREYLMHLKKEYKLTTLDERCVNNSVSCLRRIPNTAYISKLTNEPTGVYCVGLTVDEVLKMSIEELYGVAMEPREVPIRVKSKRALRDMVDFACDMFDIEYTVSNSVMYLYDKLKEASSYSSIGSTEERYIKAPRKCILELIENNIATNSSNHDENNVIALELLDAGKTDTEISFVFSSIYDEPAGDYGWYNDDPSIPGKQIVNMRAKGLHRYNKRRLRDMGICNNDGCPCEWS
jgi:hypothetical protein